MRVVFMGTPEFAVASLEAVLSRHEVVLVVTQPDKPKGRGQQMAISPVKEVALKNDIAVMQPVKVREAKIIEEIAGYQPDIIVVVAFGQILPKALLEIPPLGCINVHGSLLPKYRGAAPIQWAVINGDAKTGITTMYMAEGLDSGDMIQKAEVDISVEDTYGSLYDKMKLAGANLLLETLEAIANNTAMREEQNHEDATFAPMITKETGHIDWNWPCEKIIHLIRGLDPAPNAYTVFDGMVLKIWKAEAVFEASYSGSFGEIVAHTKRGFLVKVQDCCLLVTEVQAKGGKRMTADAYLRGHQMPVGTILS